MDLREAYGVLELAVGANEEAVRDARKTLAKVWHPDRHANDPELEKKAQLKLASINAAYETIREAGFPDALPAAKEPPKRGPPKPQEPHEPPRSPEPPRPKYDPRPAPAPTPKIEFVPRRRVRWSVLVVLCAALGVGAYLAIVKLGSSTPKVTERPHPDAAVVPTPAPDAAVTLIDASHVPMTGTFGLGSTHDQVIAAQGQPTKQDTVVDEEWSYGASLVTFNKRGKVVGWWDRDDILNVKLEPGDPDVAAKAKAAGSFGMGATKDEVIGVQGTPRRIDNVVDETWYFGKESNVIFNGTGKVRGYHNSNNELNIQ